MADQEWSLDGIYRALGAIAFTWAGRALIQSWRVAHRREFEAHRAIILELQRMNQELYAALQEAKRENDRLKSDLDVR